MFLCGIRGKGNGKKREILAMTNRVVAVSDPDSLSRCHYWRRKIIPNVRLVSYRVQLVVRTSKHGLAREKMRLRVWILGKNACLKRKMHCRLLLLRTSCAQSCGIKENPIAQTRNPKRTANVSWMLWKSSEPNLNRLRCRSCADNSVVLRRNRWTNITN